MAVLQMTSAVELMQIVIARFGSHSKWIDAPLSEVKLLSNTHIGSVGQEFVREWCKSLGLSWDAPPSTQSPWDARIQGITFEIKTATEDVNGSFQFNHVRYHRSYDALLCLGVAPETILFDAWRKGYVTEGRAGKLVTMDRGSSATFKLTKKKALLRPITEFQERIELIIADLS